MSKKYYWLKLHRDFFKRHDVRIMEAQENGKEYVVFYLKLLTESIDHEGRLRYSDTVPYDEKMLSIITGTNIDIVRSAVSAFVAMGLMEQWDDGTYYMSFVQTMIGSETDSAARQRLTRQRQVSHCAKMSQKCHTEIEIDIDKEKEIDTKTATAKPPKVKRGTYGHVRLTSDEYEKLVNDWGKEETDRMITVLDEGIELKGYKYKSHYLAIKRWHEREKPDILEMNPHAELIERLRKENEQH